MSSIKILGIDLGKSCFHLIGRDSHDQIIFHKKLSRPKLLEHLAQLEPCIVAFEACGGAHWLGRICQSHGHDVRLIPPQYVKPFVKGNKNDFIDAQAIIEAALRPDMRTVAVKPVESQSQAVIHRLREGFVAERTACMSRIGAILLEFGLSLPKGHCTMKRLYSWLANQKVELCPVIIEELQVIHDHYLYLNERVAKQDVKVTRHVNLDVRCQLLKTVPGIGVITASQTVIEMGNATQFKNGREASAWLGLVPRQYSTGGKSKLLGISKRGNKRLRCLFVHCARSVLSRLDKYQGKLYDWLRKLRLTKSFNTVCIALANKLVRIAYAVLSKHEPYLVQEV